MAYWWFEMITELDPFWYFVITIGIFALVILVTGSMFSDVYTEINNKYDDIMKQVKEEKEEKQKPQVRYNAPNEYDAVKDFSLKYLVEPLEGALGHDMVKTNSNNCQIIEIIELTDRPYDIEIKVKGKGVKDDS